MDLYLECILAAFDVDYSTNAFNQKSPISGIFKKSVLNFKYEYTAF